MKHFFTARLAGDVQTFLFIPCDEGCLITGVTGSRSIEAPLASLFSENTRRESTNDLATGIRKCISTIVCLEYEPSNELLEVIVKIPTISDANPSLEGCVRKAGSIMAIRLLEFIENCDPVFISDCC
ncbi:hypothetical protein C480_20854 [Natrialba aegyptia DSM 13077]|uniref:Uncharacterized protein n=1 Tax=Natrialba aegyptia DSM 13077 TaxID=1227491 RepID=M0AJU7_9EURY|nr:hypothetical protein [Natrialba aegyptia]ELY98965.1 hypothetical protein C480_20854 [Natrialba aegyptia DSM 13077]